MEGRHTERLDMLVVSFYENMVSELMSNITQFIRVVMTADLMKGRQLESFEISGRWHVGS